MTRTNSRHKTIATTVLAPDKSNPKSRCIINNTPIQFHHHRFFEAVQIFEAPTTTILWQCKVIPSHRMTGAFERLVTPNEVSTELFSFITYGLGNKVDCIVYIGKAAGTV
ncbi:S-adenosylmethionine:tRNA ribosyltransferase-isomerase [Sesbania bispinosa]|nr:S-adenosylmethionine:tRNA ribosyltransferase-isomerase [Sesbania bispinosa]